MSYIAVGSAQAPREPRGGPPSRPEPGRGPSPGELPGLAEEALLGRRARQGDPEALEILVTRNLRLVTRIARDFEGRGLALEDLVGEGNLGLIRAARRFDPDFGVPFGTYAAHWIRQAIRHALISTTAPIRLPSHMVRLLTKWRRAEKEYRSRHGHGPSREALAAMLGLDAAKRRMVEQALNALRPPAAPGEGRGPGRGIEEVPSGHEGPEAPLLAGEERRAVWELLGRLDDRERRLLTSRFGLDGRRPATLAEAGRCLGISRGWASKIEKRAIQRLGCHLCGDRGGDGPPAGPPRGRARPPEPGNRR